MAKSKLNTLLKKRDNHMFLSLFMLLEIVFRSMSLSLTFYNQVHVIQLKQSKS